MEQSQNTFGGNQGRQDRGGYGGGDQGWNNRRPERVFENSNRGRQPDNHGEERQSYVNNDGQAFHGDSDNRMKNRGGQRVGLERQMLRDKVKSWLNLSF